MSQQAQPDYNCFQKQVLLLEGCHQIYRSSTLKQYPTLETIIPLDECPLSQLSTKYLQYLSGLNKEKYSSQDIWKGLLSVNPCHFLKCFVCYAVASSAFLLYSIVSIYLFEVMYEEKKAINLGYIYWLVFMLCLVWFYQNIFLGMAGNYMEIAINDSKRILFYSIYARIIDHQSSGLKGKVKGKILNSLTEFHDILEDYSWIVVQLLSSSLTIIGIFSIFFVKLGWLGLVFLFGFILIMVIQYLYSEYNSRHLQLVAKLKDKRTSYLSQTLSFLKYIKMQGWQGLFMRKISKVRAQEFRSNIKYAAGSGLQQVIQAYQIQPILILTLVIAYNFTSTQINSKLIAMMSLSLCMLQRSLIQTSLAIRSFFQISILFERVAQIFNLEYVTKEIESQQAKIEKNKQHSDQVISLNQVSYSYKQKEPILNEISLIVKKGEFVTIIGEIGSGKTTLLDCISSQLTKVKGSISIPFSLVYLEQDAAIFSGLLRNNITLEQAYHQQYYNQVIELCCLKEDFQVLQKGDLTYIEEKLINLSGGQKSRIALARALYSKSKVLLLDDPLSSLDVKVGQKIFNSLMGLCKHKGYTILMTLHQINFITKENTVYLLQNSKLRNITNEQLEKLHFRKNQVTNLDNQLPEFSNDQLPVLAQDASEDGSDLDSEDLNNYSMAEEEASLQNSSAQKQTSLVKMFFKYILNCRANYFFTAITTIFYIISELLIVVIFQLFGKYDELRSKSQYFQTFTAFIVIQSLLTGVYLIATWLRVFFLNYVVQNSNRKLFKDMTYSLMKGSLNYYKGRSSGAVLDKYTVDLGSLDSSAIQHLEQQLNVFFHNFSCFVYLIIFDPKLTVLLALLVIICYLFHSYCAPAVIAQRQLNLLYKGDQILTHFEQTMKGLKTIQAYHLQQPMKRKIEKFLYNSTKSCLSYDKTFSSYRVYSKQLSNIVTTLLFFAIVKLSQNNVKKLFYPTLALFDLSWGFYYIFIQTLYVNSVFVSHQRISAFIYQINKFKQSIKLRFNKLNNSQKKSNYGQSFGNVIEIRHLTLRYNENSQPALKNINITIEKGKKVAIVGRTGSGKSSFVQALYRLVQPENSTSYFINGKDAMEMDLEALRSQFSCIPQQPFVFNDTLRKNLDPFDQYSDKQIQAVLSKLNLLEILKNSEKGLNSSIEHKQISFSYGETQLICLARAILQKKQILVMDEAGSNVDEKTDAVIKSVVREYFKDTTLITIAHKLLTILDYDTIMVFENGEIVERGTAIQLISKRKAFYQMIEQNPQIAERSYKILGIQPPNKLKDQ